MIDLQAGNREDCVSEGLVPRIVEQLVHRTRLQRLTDWLFGYDFFISYRRSDGEDYALRLVKLLRTYKYDCFLDTADYRPGENWVAGGRLALRRTTRLVFLCTRDAVADPRGRRGAEDPVVRELQAFSREGRQKILIKLDELSDAEWRASEVGGFFSAYDLFLVDDRRGPSQDVLEGLDRGCRLEKRNRRRLRVIRATCGLLAGLAAVLGWALYRAREENRVARHNLGVARVHEANRLAGESRHLEAMDTLASALGMPPLAVTDTPRVPVGPPLLRPGSEDMRKARMTLHTLLNDALVPRPPHIPARGAIKQVVWGSGEKGPMGLVLAKDGRSAVLHRLGPPGQVVAVQFSPPAAVLGSQIPKDGVLPWIDEGGALHALNLSGLVDRRVAGGTEALRRATRLWASPKGESVALLEATPGGGGRLRWRQGQQAESTTLVGSWAPESVVAFLDETHLLACGPNPFPGESLVSNVWWAVLYERGKGQPVARMGVDGQLIVGHSGVLYPGVTAVARVEGDPPSLALGCSDGTVRLLGVERSKAASPSAQRALRLVQQRVFLQPPSLDEAITCLTAVQDGSKLLAGTEKGTLLTWLTAGGQLLNVSIAYPTAVMSVWSHGDDDFSTDATGHLKFWRDRPFIDSRSLYQEITDLVVSEDNLVEVLPAHGVIHRFRATPSGLVQAPGARPDLAAWKARRAEGELRKRALQEVQTQFPHRKLEHILRAKDGKRALLTFEDGWAELWKLDRSGRAVRSLWRTEILGPPGFAVNVALAPDESRVAIAGWATAQTKWVRILRFDSGEELFRCRGDGVDQFGSPHFVGFANGGRHLVTGLYGTVFLWSTDLPTFQE